MSVSSSQIFEEISAKYPEVPRLVLRKVDTIVRGGVEVTDRALDVARQQNALFEWTDTVDGKQVKTNILGGAALRDGTHLHYVQANSNPGTGRGRGIKLLYGDEVAYTIDVVDGKPFLFDSDKPVEEVFFTPVPKFYGKATSRGTPMHKVAGGGTPEAISLGINRYCHFWDEKVPCRYCYGYGFARRPNEFKSEEELEDIYETVTEALKEKGRWTGIRLTSGSDPTGETRYKNEVDQHLLVLKAIKRSFGVDKLPVRLIASAFPEEQQLRLAEAGVTAIEPHLEVWDKKLFEWICPGKSKYYGRDYWINSAIAGVKIFGRGNVCSQFVGGVELAQPNGFKTIDEAVASTTEGAEFFAQHGVTTTINLLTLRKGSFITHEQQGRPTLEYGVKIVSALRDVRKKYQLLVDYNDYKRCKIHPDADFSRIDYPDVRI